jgi:hypothetical protein
MFDMNQYEMPTWTSAFHTAAVCDHCEPDVSPLALITSGSVPVVTAENALTESKLIFVLTPQHGDVGGVVEAERAPQRDCPFDADARSEP